MRKGSRVAWTYQGTTTHGTVAGVRGTRASIPGRSKGSQVTRTGSKDDPIIELISESTGNRVLKRRSQLKPAPKKK